MSARIGLGELLIILFVALLVFGPDKLPALGRTLGKATGKAKAFIHSITKELEDEDGALSDELDQIAKDIRDIKKDINK